MPKRKMVKVEAEIESEARDFCEALAKLNHMSLSELLRDMILSDLNAILHSTNGAYVNGEDLRELYGLKQILDC